MTTRRDNVPFLVYMTDAIASPNYALLELSADGSPTLLVAAQAMDAHQQICIMIQAIVIRYFEPLLKRRKTWWQLHTQKRTVLGELVDLFMPRTEEESSRAELVVAMLLGIGAPPENNRSICEYIAIPIDIVEKVTTMRRRRLEGLDDYYHQAVNAMLLDLASAYFFYEKGSIEQRREAIQWFRQVLSRFFLLNESGEHLANHDSM